MKTSKPRTDISYRLLLIAVILFNALVPTAALAKTSTAENRNSESRNEIETKRQIENNNRQQSFSRPIAGVGSELQQSQSGRTMTLTGVTAYHGGGVPVIPPDGITCNEYNNGIRCDFDLTAVADGFWGVWWFRSWTVTWEDSEPGNNHLYYGFAAATAPDVYWYHDPSINFFGWDRFSNGAVPPVGYGYVTVSQSQTWDESVDIQLSVPNDGSYGPNATFLGYFIISPDPIGGLLDPNSVLFSGNNGSASGLGGFGSIENACTISCIEGSQGKAGDPINTGSGVFSENFSDLSFPTAAGELIFQRSYSSGATSLYTSPLGHGWTHNHAAKLILPSDPGGVAEHVIFQSITGNQYKYKIESDGSYTPAPGVIALLTKSATEYTLVTSDQSTFHFDLLGRLTSRANAQGQAFSYLYDSQDRLDKVSADSGARFIELGYDSQGRIELVADHTGRHVSYDYDLAGDLVSFVDVMEQTWTYAYEAHRMTEINDPNGSQSLRTDYDAQGRAFRQWDGLDKKLVELTYNPDGTTTVTDAMGNTRTHTYDFRGTLTNDSDEAGSMTEKTYDLNFRPETIEDANGHPTVLTWSEDGVNLEYVKDARNNETFISYNSSNNPISMIDPSEFETKYYYEDPNFPARPTRVEPQLSFDNGITFIGTDYEYYPPSSDASAGKIKFATDALGHKIHYTYTSLGQPDLVTTAYQTPNAQTTDYDYDDLGRLAKVTDPAGVITRNKYDAAGRHTVTIHNVDPSDPDAENPQQNLASADGKNIYNVYTRYYYDTRGNQIAVVDTYWTITRTYYDLANRPVSVVENLVINDIAANSDAEVVAAINTPLADVPAYDPNYPDRNIQSKTAYDDAGNVWETHDPEGVITSNTYDEANRLVLTIQNFIGTGEYNPVNPDQNVRTEYDYDANRNVIATKDVLGVVTRTYYDELNRPELIVQNWVGTDILTDPPPSRDAGECGKVINVCTENFYDENGNLIATRDPNGVITRTYYDSLNRPITVVENLVGQAITDPNPPDRDPNALNAAVSSNIRTDTWYDQAGNVVAAQDPRGLWTRTYYDEANRSVATLQNWTGTDMYGDLTTAPPYNPANPHQNVRTTIAYNSDGRRDTTTAPLGRATKYEYDDAGRLLKTIVNYVNGGIPQNDDDQRNIVTKYAYDALGRQIRTTDTLSRITLNSYDDLGRLMKVTQNYLEGQDPNYKDAVGDQYNLITSYSYDSGGNQIAVIDTAGAITRTYYDALSRPLSVVHNLVGQSISVESPPTRVNPPSSKSNLRTDTVYLGNGAVDYVLDELEKKTEYDYDALGRLTTILDPLLNPTNFEYDANGNRTLMTTFKTETEPTSTKYEYDSLNRLDAVIENFRTGVTPDHETNVRTEYTYDASGNRLSILDGNNNSTFSTYTVFGQLETETDPLGNTTHYDYDALGNRVYLKDAKDQITLFGYDELNRLSLIDYPAPDTDVTFDYDALGRRQSMGDGLGTTVWDYNNLDLPISITDPFSESVLYDYDEVGNRTSLTYPDSRVVSYEYNALNRLETVTSDQSSVASYEYDAAGHLKTVTRPNGVNSLYNYFDNGWLQDITHSSGSTTLASYQYQYYDNGNRRQAIENVLLPSQMGSSASSFAPLNPSMAELSPTPTTTPTATPMSTSTVANAPSSSDLIFADGFESGELSAWTFSTTDQGDLSASADAALIGNQGLQAVINDSDAIYLTDDSLNSETNYWGRFYFDPNSLIMVDGHAHFIFKGFDGVSTEVLRVEFGQYSDEYQIRASLLDDASTWVNSNWFTIDDNPHYIEINWRAARTVDSNDGGLSLWIDGAQEEDLAAVDNDTWRLDRVQLGALSEIDPGTRGTYYFDAFESRGNNHTGPLGQARTGNYAYASLKLNNPLENGSLVWNQAPFYQDNPTETPTATPSLTPTSTSTVTPTLTSTPAPTSTLTPTLTMMPTPGIVGNVVALLHMNGQDASTTFTDELGKTWTASGDAQIDTEQSKFGGASGSFDGTGDSITTPDHNDFHLSNVDWTIDFWVRFNSISGTINLVSQYQDSNNWMDVWSTLDGTRLHFAHKSGGAIAAQFNASVSFSTNTWYHLAIERDGNTPKIAINGTFLDVTENTTISGKTLSNLSGPLAIATFNGNGSLNGWIDEFRFSKGIARWTSNFTPPVSEYIYAFLPSATTLVSPNGNIFVNQPEYTWNKATNTSWYRLFVSRVNADTSLTTVLDTWYSASSACNGSTCSATPNVTLSAANYRWWIQTWNDAGYGPWSSGMNFTPTVPGAATLVSPTGINTEIPAVFTWNKVAGADSYYLWVSRVNGDGSLSTSHNQWYDASAVCSASTCSVNSVYVSTHGVNYRWWIQTRNSVGNGPWSSAMNFTGTQPTSTPTFTPTFTPTPTATPLPPEPITIDYVYDPLNRLTEANYSTGDYYHYAYDEVGNRLTQTSLILGLSSTASYIYDDANRLSSVNGVIYSWDDNGNLLNDGLNTYTYDSANRLVAFSGQGTNATYAYNGLGDRIQETLNGQTTTFTMDLNTGLTQALSDGTNTYMYGNDSIAQTQGSTTEYFLGDALGSVRQMASGSGTITYARTYDPYGVVTATSGSSQSADGYTGEYTDSYIKLIYLRSRMYDPLTGRFTTKDSWQGDYNRPMSLNRWMYVEGNPVNYTDPTGLIKQSESVEADKIVKELKTYNAYVRVDWGEWRYWYNDPIDSNKSGIRCDWNDGEWYLNELIEIRKGVIDSARAMGFNNFIFNFGYINIIKEKLDDPKDIARGGPHVMKVNNNKHIINRWTTVHELGHVWDANFGWGLSKDLVALTTQYGTNWGPSAICDPDNKLPGCNASGYVYYDVLAYGSGNTMNPREDFANSFAAYVYPEDSQTQIQKYETLNQGLYADYLYYTDYRTTLRWRIIDALIRSTNSFRPR